MEKILTETDGRSADVMMVAAPTHSAQELALQIVNKRGRVNFFTGLPKDNFYIQFNSNLVPYKEFSTQGTHAATARQNKLALELVSAGRINVADVITHTFPMQRIVHGIVTVRKGEGLKVVINPRKFVAFLVAGKR